MHPNIFSAIKPPLPSLKISEMLHTHRRHSSLSLHSIRSLINKRSGSNRRRTRWTGLILDWRRLAQQSQNGRSAALHQVSNNQNNTQCVHPIRLHNNYDQLEW